MEVGNDTLTKDWVKLHASKSNRKKMYKAKKQWVVASATLIALAGAGMAVSTSTHASTVPNANNHNSSSQKADNAKSSQSGLSKYVDNPSSQDKINLLAKNAENAGKMTDKPSNSVNTKQNAGVHNNLNNKQNNSNQSTSNQNANDSQNNQRSAKLNSGSHKASGIEDPEIKKLTDDSVVKSAIDSKNNLVKLDKPANGSARELGTKPLPLTNTRLSSIAEKVQNNKQVAMPNQNSNKGSKLLRGVTPSLSNMNLIKFVLSSDPSKVVAEDTTGFGSPIPSGLNVMPFIKSMMSTKVPDPGSSNNQNYRIDPIYGYSLPSTFTSTGSHVLNIPVTPKPGHTPGTFMTVNLNTRDYYNDDPLVSNTIPISFNTDQLNIFTSPSQYPITDLMSETNNGPEQSYSATVNSNIYLNAKAKELNSESSGELTFTPYDAIGAFSQSLVPSSHVDTYPLKNGQTYDIWFKYSLPEIHLFYKDDSDGKIIDTSHAKSLSQDDWGRSYASLLGSMPTDDNPDPSKYNIKPGWTAPSAGLIQGLPTVPVIVDLVPKTYENSTRVYVSLNGGSPTYNSTATFKDPNGKSEDITAPSIPNYIAQKPFETVTTTKGSTTDPSSVTFDYKANIEKNNLLIEYQREGPNGDANPVPIKTIQLSGNPGTSKSISAPDKSAIPALKYWSLDSSELPGNVTISNGSNASPASVVFYYTENKATNKVNVQYQREGKNGDPNPVPAGTITFNDYIGDMKTVPAPNQSSIPKLHGWSLDTNRLPHQVKMTPNSDTDPNTVTFYYTENTVKPNAKIDLIEEDKNGNKVGSFGYYTDSNTYYPNDKASYDGNTIGGQEDVPNGYTLDTSNGKPASWSMTVKGDNAYTATSNNGANVSSPKDLYFYYKPIKQTPPAPKNATGDVYITLYQVNKGEIPTVLNQFTVPVNEVPGNTKSYAPYVYKPSDYLGALPSGYKVDPGYGSDNREHDVIPNGSSVKVTPIGSNGSADSIVFYYDAPVVHHIKPHYKTLQPVTFEYVYNGQIKGTSPVIKPDDKYMDNRELNPKDYFPEAQPNLIGQYHMPADVHATRFSDVPQIIQVPIESSIYKEDVPLKLVEEDPNGNTVKVVTSPTVPDYTTPHSQDDFKIFRISDYTQYVPGYTPDPNHQQSQKVEFGPGDDNASQNSVTFHYLPAEEPIPVHFEDVTDGNKTVTGNINTANFKYLTKFTTADAGNQVGIPEHYVLVPNQTGPADTHTVELTNGTVNVKIAPIKCGPIHVEYIDQHNKVLDKTAVYYPRFTWQTAGQLGNDGWNQVNIPDSYYVVPNQNTEYQFGPDSGKTVVVKAFGKEKNLNYHIRRYMEAPDGEVINQASPIEAPATMRFGDTMSFKASDYPIPGYSPDPTRTNVSTIKLNENGSSTISNDEFFYKADPSGTNSVQPVTVTYKLDSGKKLGTKVLTGYMGQRINVTDEDTVPEGYRLEGNQQTEHTFSQSPAKPMNLIVKAIPIHARVTNKATHQKFDYGTTVEEPKVSHNDYYVDDHTSDIQRVGVKHHFKWFWVIKTLRIHTGLKFNNHNYFRVIHPHQHFTFKILRIYRVHGKIRYMIRFDHRIGYVTGDSHWTQNAYFSKRDLKKFDSKKRNRYGKRIRHYVLIYNHTDYIHRQTKFNHWVVPRKLHRGKIMRVYGIKHIGPKYGGMTRFILGNGEYITSNKNCVKIIK